MSASTRSDSISREPEDRDATAQVPTRSRRAPARAGDQEPSRRVRAATHDDLAAIVLALGELLSELGSTPPPASAMTATAATLLDDPQAGALLVAEAGGQIVGVLGASWQLAIHVPGRYALIQDLWVHPSWRGRSVGRELLAALCELAREQGMARAEVGLPRESFESIRATEGFYARNGFEHLGARMRRLLP
jgi:GNAT superfamily N-acetyltransferase